GASNFVPQFRSAIFQHLGRAIKNLAAEISRPFRPAFESYASGDYCISKIFARGVAKIIQQLALRGFGLQIATTLTAHKITTDIELVSFADIQTRAHRDLRGRLES